jgi:hypothetical protein
VQRLARRIVPRLSVLSGLGSLALVLHGLTLLQPAPWSAPTIVATDRGFLVAWLDGEDDRVPLRVQAVGPDLSPVGRAHSLGLGWSEARILLDHDPGQGTRVRLVGDPGQPPWRVVGAIDEQGRPQRRPPAVRDWPAELRPAPPAPESPTIQRCRAFSSGAPVRDAAGKTRARMTLAPGGWARLVAAPGGATLTDDRIGPASCAALSSGPCLAGAADDRGVVVAWTRRRALGSELVVTRLSGAGREARTERMLRRSPSFALALAFAAFVGLVAGLAGHAASRSLEASRVLAALLRRRRQVCLDGRLDDPANLVAGADRAEYRMRTAAAWLQAHGGQRVVLRPGRPLVVTGAALQGELPALAAVVATFDHVWVAGRALPDHELGPYRGGGGSALEVHVLSDRPLSVVRGAMLARLGWSLVDALALIGVVILSFATIL